MAGSINLANVALGFDSSQLTKGVDLSGAELRKLTGIIKESISPVDKYSDEMIILDKAFQKGALTAERFAAASDQLAKKYGIETYAMIEARQAAEKLEAKKKEQIETNIRLAEAERKYGEMLAAAQRDMLARQKQLDSELAIGLNLRKQVATADERNAAAIKQYDQYLKQGIIDLQTYNRLLDQMRAKPPASPPVGSSVFGSDIKSTLAQYVGMAAAFAGVKKSLSLAATAETNKISLEVLTGSVEKAQYLFEGFVELDRSSPLSRSDFSRAAQTLVGYGLAAGSTLPALRQLSEISIGNADRLQSLALAFGQVQANGRLMGQEVLQMINAGFNPLQEISRTTGRSMVELKKAMEDGAITSGMTADALKSATSEGGRFFEMNEKLKNSAAGQWAKMKSDVEMLATSIGTELLPVAKSFMDLMKSGGDDNGNSGLSGLAVKTVSVWAQGMEMASAVLQDAFTNLDGNSQGTVLKDLLDRKKMQELMKPPVKTKEQKEQIAREIEQEAEEERKLAEEINAKAKADAAWLKNEEKSSAQAVAAIKRREAEKLMLEEFKYKEASIRKEFAERNKKEAEQMGRSGGVGSTETPLLRAGSVEAYKFMMSQKDKQAEATERHIRVSEESKAVLEKQLDALNHQRTMQTKR